MLATVVPSVPAAVVSEADAEDDEDGSPDSPVKAVKPKSVSEPRHQKLAKNKHARTVCGLEKELRGVLER